MKILKSLNPTLIFATLVAGILLYLGAVFLTPLYNLELTRSIQNGDIASYENSETPLSFQAQDTAYFKAILESSVILLPALIALVISIKRRKYWLSTLLVWCFALLTPRSLLIDYPSLAKLVGAPGNVLLGFGIEYKLIANVLLYTSHGIVLLVLIWLKFGLPQKEV